MKYSLKSYLKHAELSPDERRDVLEDLFIFGKANRRPFLIRMSVLMVLSTIIAGVVQPLLRRDLAGAVDGYRGCPAVRFHHAAFPGYRLYAGAGAGQNPADVL